MILFVSQDSSAHQSKVSIAGRPICADWELQRQDVEGGAAFSRQTGGCSVSKVSFYSYLSGWSTSSLSYGLVGYSNLLYTSCCENIFLFGLSVFYYESWGWKRGGGGEERRGEGRRREGREWKKIGS